MIDDPELPAPDRRPRPTEPGWGDPFASYAVPGGAGVAAVGGTGTDPERDPWAVDVPSIDGDEIAGDHAGAPDRADRGSKAAPLVLALLRPWFEPRPGELRGAIIVLSVALAVSMALWFDASRRPQAAVDVAVPIAAPPAPVVPMQDGMGRADGSDGWGLGADPSAQRGPVVHISGAVMSPGVVTVPDRSRVADAIDAVGGAMPDARLDRLNLARIVEDGERIHVPRVGEDAPPPEESASRGVLTDGRIDLNAASQTELETLPGVGPARAQAIIAEREVRPFRVPGDLRRVPGIGEATFQRLAPLVAVR